MHNDLSPELQSSLDIITQSFRAQFTDFQRGQANRRADADRKGVVRFSRAIQQMMDNRGLADGPEKEFFDEVAKARGGRFDPHRITLPLGCLTRDLTVAQAAAGGFLVGSDLGEAQDVLRPWSIVMQGGVTVEENLTGNVVIPKTLAGTSIAWQATEGAPSSASSPTLSQTSMTPKVAIGIVNASRTFMLQANPERWLRRELTRVAGVAVDTATLVGSGVSGQPLGILNYAGLSTQSGTSLAWAGVLAMKKNASVANVADGSTSFISTPTVRALLEARERATGNGGFIWENDRIASCPAFASTLMPTGAAISGPLAGITLGLWSDLRIEINPFETAQFKTGQVMIRVLVAVDTALTVDPLSFTTSTSIT
jgi:HK97 family phage major capsid protein